MSKLFKKAKQSTRNALFFSFLKTVKLLSAFEPHSVPILNKNKATLITIPFSHYSERARWLLDYIGFPYEDKMHGPMFHLCSTLITASKLPRHSLTNVNHLEKADETEKKLQKRKELTGVPKLILKPMKLTHVKVIPFGSAGIFQYCYEENLAPFLYPAEVPKEKIYELENYLDKELAMPLTYYLLGYILLPSIHQENDNLLMSKEFFENYLQKQTNIPLIERLLFQLFGNTLIKSIMVPANQITKENIFLSKEKIRKVFQRMDELLSQSSTKFFFNTNSPTSIEFTFASYAFPLFFPKELTNSMGRLPIFWSKEEIDRFPDCPGKVEILAFSQELLKDYQSARFVVEFYEQYRWARKKD